MDSVNGVLLDSIREFVHRLVNFIPNILVMFFVVLIGIIISTAVRFVLLWFLRFINFDDMAEKAGISEILDRGGISIAPARIAVSITYWGIMFVFLMMGFVALDVVPINNLISDFLSYLPSIIAAAMIVIVGFILGNFVERAVLVAAVNADISQAEMIGKGVKLLTVVMTFSMALDQLGIARGIIIAAFSIAFGGIVFAVSLAFGLGAKDLAREFLEKKLREKPKSGESL